MILSLTNIFVTCQMNLEHKGILGIYTVYHGKSEAADHTYIQPYSQGAPRWWASRCWEKGIQKQEHRFWNLGVIDLNSSCAIYYVVTEK